MLSTLKCRGNAQKNAGNGIYETPNFKIFLVLTFMATYTFIYKPSTFKFIDSPGQMTKIYKPISQRMLT